MGAPSYYPRWPESNQDAEHWEIPPQHFLAAQAHQQQLSSSSSALTLDAMDTLAWDAPWYDAPMATSSAPSSKASKRKSSHRPSHTASPSTVEHVSIAAYGEPLAELTNALPYIVGPGGASIRSSASASASTSPSPRSGRTPTHSRSGSTAFLQQEQYRYPFLNTPSSASQGPGSGSGTVPFAAVPDPSLPDTSTLAAADFDIDVRSGFMPPEPPVQRLAATGTGAGAEAEVEAQWEDMLDRARSLPLRCGGGGKDESVEARRAAWQWRRDIRKMSAQPLSSSLSTDIRQARRGHLVLAFLAHFYIHSQPPPIIQEDLDKELGRAPPTSQAGTSGSASNTPTTWLSRLTSWQAEPPAEGAAVDNAGGLDHPLGLQDIEDQNDYTTERLGAFADVIPAALAVPWCALSTKLDLPPILTYATTVLWNWGLVDPRQPASAPGNLRILTTFTGTRSEEWFYATSALIELRGVEALTLMRRSLDEAFLADSLARTKLTLFLRRLARVVGELERILAEVRRECDPAMFYFAIRPWFRASDDARGWHYEGVDPPGVRRPLTGPSAGQSSLIHALDQFLAIEHSADEQAPAGPSTSTTPNPTSNATFMQRMSLYMPGHHRRFLEHLRKMNVEDSMLESQRELERARQEARREGMAGDAASGEGQAKEGQDDEVQMEGGLGTTPSALAAASTLHPIRRLALTPAPTPAPAPAPAATSPTTDPSKPAPQPFQPTPLSRAYDAALAALKSLRDKHMRIATLYIITQARRGAPPEGVRSWLPGSFTGVREEGGGAGGGVAKGALAKGKAEGRPVAVAVETPPAPAIATATADADAAKGTGGTPLVSFLKSCRANTVRAMLEPDQALKSSKKKAVRRGG